MESVERLRCCDRGRRLSEAKLNEKGVLNPEHALLVLLRDELELEANCQLNLTFAEQCAVRSSRGSEWSVVCKRCTGQGVEGAINTGDLCSIEEVEAFDQNF